MLKKILIMVFTLFISSQSMAMETLVNKPSGPARGLVIIAPAKKYLMKERLFFELATKLSREGYVTVRFNWASDTLQNPELELQKASRDINYIVQAAQRHFGFRPAQTVLISKSFSTKALEASVSLAKTHILLTPNCSVEAPFRKVYWNILNRSDLLLRIIISNEDPYCNVDEIRQTLKILSKTSLLGTTHGDHNFVVQTPANQPSFVYQDQIINSVVQQLRYLGFLKR